MKDKAASHKLLENTASTAKHRLISDRLLSEIEVGKWRPGDQLPSEEQLAADTQASLGTVQRALRNLVEMGVVERHHGRGTFVCGARAPERHLTHFRFLAEGGKQLLPVYFNILDIDTIEETGPWQDFLKESEGRFVRIRRIASINHEFEAFSEVYLPAERFAGVARMKRAMLDGVSIRDMLAERFNAPTIKIRQTMLCQALPPRVTRLIGVPAGQYGIVWSIGAMSYRDAPITWQRIFLPPSDRVLEIAPGPAFEMATKAASN
ncbi:GntR family transcriptional regulator [Afifella pfennigii]|uniref:GntR family transcriptional regulator n=1 Tax=Afifella pfennigii TaxID=209897 RepID=UPI00047A6360|nr:GntR family transcriptional regulator [Afifella pfennigii]